MYLITILLVSMYKERYYENKKTNYTREYHNNIIIYSMIFILKEANLLFYFYQFINIDTVFFFMS